MVTAASSKKYFCIDKKERARTVWFIKVICKWTWIMATIYIGIEPQQIHQINKR